MKPDHYFHVADPEVIGQRDAPNLILRFQTVKTRQGRSQRSGKYIHLELTNALAMQLLAHLKGAQAHLGLPEAPQPSTISVPPAKDRN